MLLLSDNQKIKGLLDLTDCRWSTHLFTNVSSFSLYNLLISLSFSLPNVFVINFVFDLSEITDFSLVFAFSVFLISLQVLLPSVKTVSSSMCGGVEFVCVHTWLFATCVCVEGYCVCFPSLVSYTPSTMSFLCLYPFTFPYLSIIPLLY